MDSVELAPLRTVNDFCLEGARFQIPQTNDPNRWANRIINNLLYYQTNYFCMAILTFLAVGFMNPVMMMTGVLTVLIVLTLFIQVTNNRDDLKRYKQEHPIITLCAIIAFIYFIGRMFGSLMVFSFGLLLPFTLTLIHASLRMRNVNNKISRFKEYVGLKRTPMGILLEGLGQEQEAGS